MIRVNFIEPRWWLVQSKRWFPTPEWCRHHHWLVRLAAEPVVAAIRDPNHSLAGLGDDEAQEMTKAELAAIKARAEKATPGPWVDYGTGVIDNDGGEIAVCNYIDGKQGQHEENQNVEFIAHSRSDVPRLVAEVERLTKKNRQLVAMLKNAGMDERVTAGLADDA